tara:strand:+ start:1593 stop:2006 length:414 start_codon:yes stop_codon:yes gene_type:complete
MGTQIKSIPPEVTWPLRQAVMWPDKPLDYIKLPKDHQGMHFGLFRDGELVSVGSLFINDGTAQFRKLATKTSEQGKGYGSKILVFLLKEAQHNGVAMIWCNARQDKAGFYKKFGLIETSKTFTKGNIDYVIMEKVLL